MQGALVLTPEGEFHQLAEWRITGFAAVAQFLLGKAHKVVPERKLHHRFIGIERLQQHLAITLGATGAARGLAQQLEQPFRTAEIRHSEAAIGPHDTNKFHTGEIVALRHHLRTQQYIVFPVAERVQDLFDSPHILRGIAVHAHHLSTRNPFANFFLKLFDGAPHILVCGRPAGRTWRVYRV